MKNITLKIYIYILKNVQSFKNRIIFSSLNNILFLDNKYNSSLFTGTAKNFKIYHWAGGKIDWIYKREHADLWTKTEVQQDPNFKLEIYNEEV